MREIGNRLICIVHGQCNASTFEFEHFMNDLFAVRIRRFKSDLKRTFLRYYKICWFILIAICMTTDYDWLCPTLEWEIRFWWILLNWNSRSNILKILPGTSLGMFLQIIGSLNWKRKEISRWYFFSKKKKLSYLITWTPYRPICYEWYHLVMATFLSN